jgi:hypothetical protein
MSGYQKKKTRDIVPGVEEKHAMFIFRILSLYVTNPLCRSKKRHRSP